MRPSTHSKEFSFLISVPFLSFFPSLSFSELLQAPIPFHPSSSSGIFFASNFSPFFSGSFPMAGGRSRAPFVHYTLQSPSPLTTADSQKIHPRMAAPGFDRV